MNFKPIQKLSVTRTLTTGEVVSVGVLAQNSQGVFFQYDTNYLSRFNNLSPFTLQTSNILQPAPKQPHTGLHGLFADSLPDGWGLLLQDRVFRQHGILPAQITAMDRLAFVGSRGMGALAFSPVSHYQTSDHDEVDLATLGLEAQALFDGQTEEVLSALVTAGSSGGARPKAQLFFPPNQPKECRTTAKPGDEAWLVKFTSQNLALGHEEGIGEATYLHLAQLAKLQPPEWQLLDAPTKSGAKAWLAVKRFDWRDNLTGGSNKPGRLHMHSACGLLDADYRTPSLDYEDLIKASSQLCKSPAAGQLQFRRAIFNLFACNQDDHSKNWAFLQEDDGQWQPAPFYDVTFSPHPFNEHATSFVGYGKKPPLKAIQKLAGHAGFSNWKQAQQHIHEILDVLSDFGKIAKEYRLHHNTITLIEKTLANRFEENKALI
ncbi:type II toxin-antitoxin system HipA family toxin [Acinetobacter nosocomialis]|uniref:type II toxin-antitoxin system HipA family toxin n=1 Tax=Acinetobacter calcoaceticus/baumannii complex TaxID=909768 RepID=UPI0021BEAFC1|nr:MULTISPECIES: type II toxin-antitoxin system HipA family toxin [Acinetobacter calcoaceticus/baumannii complex]EKT9294210.1 type II toxin-antitoxin system HipA family toxin [Acinetobacter baumannii]EKV7455396.1 type II toxin-antitoxin system HipA family toxin [Acinetobacter baumannii]EKW1355398.1 type II toxin-antitoxin system HipA family toxin [Acinetobacter baumannii]MCT9283817.1 type II toxin-antitoxin system HipA family toxin [Acinetobacter baumannii]MCU4554541.1 type II toxin-antitoxin 